MLRTPVAFICSLCLGGWFQKQAAVWRLTNNEAGDLLCAIYFPSQVEHDMPTTMIDWIVGGGICAIRQTTLGADDSNRSMYVFYGRPRKSTTNYVAFQVGSVRLFHVVEDLCLECLFSIYIL